MGIDGLLREKRDEILALAAKHGARNIPVLGSVVRGEADPDSDVDLLVDMEEGRSLLDHVALIRDIEGILGRRVDVLTENGIYWLLRRPILEEGVAL